LSKIGAWRQLTLKGSPTRLYGGANLSKEMAERFLLQRQKILFNENSKVLHNPFPSSLSLRPPTPPASNSHMNGENIPSESSTDENSSIPSPHSIPSSPHEATSSNFTFVIGADTQLGISSGCREWDYELEYSRRAVNYINQLTPKPAFVSLCGDLIDMEPSLYSEKFSHDQCLAIQSQQYHDFEQVWRLLDPAIPLLCLCGNHDVGNIPTMESVQRYVSRFGDDYFAFWHQRTYCLCLNTNLYNDHSQTETLYTLQHRWLESCLESVQEMKPDQIFLFGHHPWFLVHEEETDEEITGQNTLPNQPNKTIPDSYFHIPLEWRRDVMRMCREYKVTACFAGHYHQNLITRSSWGMPLIVTGAICNFNMQSTMKDLAIPEHSIQDAGVRVVTVDKTLPEGFSHQYCVI
jgi:serine/threonine-protein phosphatase CPPED1